MGYEKFEKLCEIKDVTPYKVAKETGVSTATLSSWKNGRYVPKKDKLKILADYFGVDVSYFDDEENVLEPTTYYFDNDTLKIAEALHKNRRLRLLFDAARDIQDDDMLLIYGIVKKLKKTNRDE